MIKTKVRYNGIAPDTRSRKEKSKDFQAKELLVSSPKIFRNIASFSEMRKGVIRNQDGSGSCFPANAQVLMEDLKYKNIADIKLGEYVITDKQNKKKVTHLFKRKWQGTMFNIKIKGQLDTIICSPEHPILAIKKEKERKPLEKDASFIEAKELVEGDWVGIATNNKVVKDLTLKSYEIDPDFLWVLGLYLAEGSIDKYGVTFSLHRDEIEFYNRIKTTMDKYGTNTTYSFKGDSKSLTVKIQGQEWSDIFLELGNKICDKKEISQKLMFLEPGLQMNIVNGLYDGDGHDMKDNGRDSKILVTTSKTLAEQTQKILARNGIYSYLNKRKRLENRKQVFTLSYSKYPRYSFLRDNIIFVKIEKITKTKSYSGGHIYNIEVEDDNTYIVNNTIVHNCVTQALAKAVEMNLEKQGFETSEIERVISALYPYQNRSNKPGAGSNPSEMGLFFHRNGFYLEKDVPSQNMNDAFMDDFVIPQTKQKKHGYQVYYFVDATPEFEEVAQYVEEFGNATILVDCDYNGYIKDIPTPNSRNHQIRHQICAVDNITLNGTRYLVIDDSWGIFGDSELAKRGQRLITKDAFNKMVEQVVVMRVMKVEKGNVDYSKYTNLPYMEYGHRNAEILRLQEMLKETGHLPKDLDTVNIDKYGKKYGYYGTITNNAVLKWQLENIKTVSQAQLKAWGGKYWGNASNIRVRELATVAGDNPPAQEYMTTKIQFKWDKFLTITGSALLLYIATNINNIEWTKAGLISAGTALIQFLAQAILKYINEEKG